MEKVQEFSHYLSETTVFINGQYVPSTDAKISVFDRGFLFGDSVYEVCYSQDGCLLFFEEHLNRLNHSAKLLKMKVFCSLEQITKQVLETLKKSELTSAYIRIILTRGESKITLDPNEAFKNNLVTIARPKPFYPKEFYENGVYLALVNTLRNDRLSMDPNAKSGNYLNNVMAIEEAKAVGAYDAIMLNKDGNVTEGTTFNVWAVKDNVVMTPPVDSGLLAGITRKTLLKLIPELNLSHLIKELTPVELLEADEVFITSSTRRIIPVSKIDKTEYGKNKQDWPITSFLMKEFDKLVSNQPSEYRYL